MEISSFHLNGGDNTCIFFSQLRCVCVCFGNFVNLPNLGLELSSSTLLTLSTLYVGHIYLLCATQVYFQKKIQYALRIRFIVLNSTTRSSNSLMNVSMHSPSSIILGNHIALVRKVLRRLDHNKIKNEKVVSLGVFHDFALYRGFKIRLSKIRVGRGSRRSSEGVEAISLRALFGIEFAGENDLRYRTNRYGPTSELNLFDEERNAIAIG